MQLTSLEIKGFKSFGDKITINFVEGITAIVGPNGCGKSNVVDAIRWVLGEQSTRTLRSEKMENIIFNGNKTRKQANLAEVSLSFSNTKNILPTDYSSVTITRKLYRSGESEYRLNDVQCRLKDITDLFLDTGIGADSYSIIELKMVEEILSNKDNSRRTLFEEAAGIAKYKIRKKQTFNKLKDTEADLSRVDDLLFEIEKNLKTLEQQAKKTERYYKLREEYKELSTLLASFRIQSFKVSLEQLEQNEAKQNEERLGNNAAIDKVEADLQKEKLENLNKEKQLAAQQMATNEFVNKIRQYESDKKLKNEQLRFLQEKEYRLNAEMSTDKKSSEELSDNLRILGESKKTEEETFNLLEKNLGLLKSELDQLQELKTKRKTELDELTSLSKNAIENAHKIEKELDILRIQKESLGQEMERAITDVTGKQEELDEFSKALHKLEFLLEEKELGLEKKQDAEEALQKSIQETEEELQKTKDKLLSQHRAIDAKQNEYNLTKSLVDNLEGFPESIKFLRKNASWAKNAPLLSDVLFCKEEYRIAIENFLEPFMNHYVVANLKEALQAINLLSDSAKGRANFFLLDAFKESKSAKASTPENCIPALSITEVEAKYQALCAHLLKDVFLITKDEEATIQNSDKEAVILLSKSGKYSRSIYSISGGSVGLFEGKRIGRAKNLEALQKDIKKAEEEINSLKDQSEKLQSKFLKLKESSFVKEINTLKQELQGLNSEHISLKTKKEQYQSFISSTSTRREDMQEKIRTLTEQITILGPELEKLKAGLQIGDDKLISLQNDYNQVAENVNQLSARYNQDNIAFHQQQNKVAGILKDLDYKQAHSASVNTRILNNSTELEKVKVEIQVILQTAGNSDVDLVEMYDQKAEMEKAVHEAEEEYYKSKAIITEFENSINALRRNKEQSEFIMNEIKDKKTELKLELNSLKERLSVEFNIDIEDLLEKEINPELKEEDIKTKNERIKNSLDNFGAINPMALEAFAEMNERYVFITTQKADLINAKNLLLQTIAEIDETAKVKFMESFVLIRENFIKVFRSLFNEEDSCDLILVNPEDPLESEIDIIAKPKGKRPLTINQLSGGEKTLTATAILFSLYLLKPAPFCIFDEVDAPLDDTNIDKFNSIIRKFSKDSQFIVVTHNKRTIASTDIVYGVTMVEQGISRVVPVDLRSLEPAA